ncbi:MAG TPA: quinone-dependent dihydroorotate dehydrogenase [Flavitalea sp.]|nr:quinone-dependent dihydroorotate dehydrogenase [Flavitalea sp.]
MYSLLRRLLFLFPAEGVHYFAMSCFSLINKIGLNKSFSKRINNIPSLRREIFGLSFKNPVGLAAGFDKNACYLDELAALGFGFIEIGTVTPKPQGGNDKPRLFRLPKDRAIVNRMGFNNDGVQVIAKRLKEWKQKNAIGKNHSAAVIGGNIGKNKATSNEEAWKDYEICFRTLFDGVDYFVVNVSSPNTPGLRELQEKDALQKILSHLQTINLQQPTQKPLLLKIAPDLSWDQINDVIDLAMEIKLDGLVATNTTISRAGLQTNDEKIKGVGAGGLSGYPLKNRSTEIVQYIHEKTRGQIPVIASGGIFTADDAKEKFRAGASLIQVWTGFIYEGPAIVKNIIKNL